MTPVELVCFSVISTDLTNAPFTAILKIIFTSRLPALRTYFPFTQTAINQMCDQLLSSKPKNL